MKRLFFVLSALCILCGCSRVTEVDSKSFVTAIGFDKGENYDLRFTFVFTSPSKSSESSSGKEEDETIVIEAPSLYSAIEQINNFKSKTIELTHTQTLVFSEELAREGLEEYIYMLVRSSHFKPNTYVCIADNSSMEFLEKINPVQTYHLEKYFQLIFNKMTSGTKGDLYLYDSYFRLLSEAKTSVLPYCAINEIKLKEAAVPGEEPTESDKEDATEGETMPGEFSEDTDDFAINILAGQTISKSDNTAEIQGVGIIKNGKLEMLLGRWEATLLQMITNSMPDSYITISNPFSKGKMITCYIVPKNNTKISVKCSENPEINIKIELEGDFTQVGQNDYFIENTTEFEEYFENKIKESLLLLLEKTKTVGDAFGFSEAAKTKFLTIDQWKAYSWAEKYEKSNFSVDVDLTIRTYGELSQIKNRG